MNKPPSKIKKEKIKDIKYDKKISIIKHDLCRQDISLHRK